MGSETTISLETVAERAGVSTRTAYRVLNGEGGLGKRRDAVERAERIRQVAHELGYRPNQAARAMREGRFATAGLVLSRGETTSSTAEGLIKGVHDGLAGHGMHLAVTRLSDDQFADERYLPGLLRELTVDGLLMYYTHDEPAELHDLIERYRIPTIWINNARPHDCVHPADHEGARQATAHLLELGHRRIAFWAFGDGGGHYSNAAREAGYGEAMAAAGLSPLVRRRELHPQRLDRRGDDFVAVGRDWLQADPGVTAVVGGSHGQALVAAIAALSLGLRVPEDLSIIFVDQSLEDTAGLGLTRYWAAASEMGRAAVDELVAKITKPGRKRRPVTIPFRLFDGRSVAPPRKRGKRG